jgi:hypothetical protein
MQFLILEPIEVRADGERVTLGSGHQETVLEMLLTHPNRVVPLHRLVEAAWDGDSPATGPKHRVRAAGEAGAGRAPTCSVIVRFCPNRSRGGGGFGWGGVVVMAFGDVQVAGIFDSRGDCGADGGPDGGPAAGAAGGGVLAEGDVPDVGMCLDGPVPADERGQVRRKLARQSPFGHSERGR